VRRLRKWPSFIIDFALNPLEFRANYSATSINMKLVHWPLMGGVLHLVQRGGNWAGPQPVQAPHRCTKCNSPPINGQCTNNVLLLICCSAVLMCPSRVKHVPFTNMTSILTGPTCSQEFWCLGPIRRRNTLRHWDSSCRASRRRCTAVAASLQPHLYDQSSSSSSRSSSSFFDLDVRILRRVDVPSVFLSVEFSTSA